MPEILYLTGDATLPSDPDRPCLIAHVCNDVGAWGAGFSGALGRRYPKARRDYKASDFELGTLVLSAINEGAIVVANMIAQQGIGTDRRRLDYDALQKCLARVCQHVATYITANFVPYVQMPRIGCGLAGGDWSRVEALIQEELCQCGVEVRVVSLPTGGTE